MPRSYVESVLDVMKKPSESLPHMQNFDPRQFEGRPVAVDMVLPIDFKLRPVAKGELKNI